MRRALLPLMALMIATPASAQFGGFGGLDSMVRKAQTIQKLGDSFTKITEEQEIKIGGDLAGIVLGAAPLVRDAGKQRAINQLGMWLALHSERPNLPWKFGIINSGDVNAFSTPGGYILISTGLIAKMRSQSELAGVLAHEIAHVVRKHHIAALQRGLRDAALTDFNAYFGRGGGIGGGIAGQFSAALIASGKSMFTHGLNAGDEFEADRMGVVIAARSGYSPYGLGGVLQTLSALPPAEKDYALFAKTHPAPVERITKLDAVMSTRLDGLMGLAENTPNFRMFNANAAPASPAKSRSPRKKKQRRDL